MVTLIYNGNRTEWSPIRSVITSIQTELDDTKSFYQLIINVTISENDKNISVKYLRQRQSLK